MDALLMDAAAIGTFLSGKSPKTGRRVLQQCPLPKYIIGQKTYVKKCDFEAWIESQRIVSEPPKQVNNLKSMLEAISAKALAGRKVTA